MNHSVDLVLSFWKEVWNPPYNLAYVDEVVSEDFIITSGGQDILSREAFKEWIQNFQSQIEHLELTALDTFANPAGDRVTSRWVLTGKNKGMFGTPADGKAIRLTGIAIWQIKEGKLHHNWVERSAMEVYRDLSQGA